MAAAAKKSSAEDKAENELYGAFLSLQNRRDVKDFLADRITQENKARRTAIGLGVDGTGGGQNHGAGEKQFLHKAPLQTPPSTTQSSSFGPIGCVK